MPDYKAMYLSLFDVVTDVLEILKAAQLKGEAIYMETDGEDPTISGNNRAVDDTGN